MAPAVASTLARPRHARRCRSHVEVLACSGLVQAPSAPSLGADRRSNLKRLTRDGREGMEET